MKRLLVFVLCLATTVLAQDSPAKYREYLDAAATVEKFSGAVLVARKGQPVFEQAYGLADRKNKQANTVQTIYSIGSMSKPITATAVMVLRDQGKIKLEDSVCLYLAPCPDTWKPITLQHLLTHTSGVADIVNFPDFMTFRLQPHTPQQLVELIASHPVDFAPGTKFVYSNSNFILLGAVIEKVTGKPYIAFVSKNVFKPAGMKASGYANPAPLGMAIGYVRDGDNIRPADETAMSVRFSAGGLYSTLGDILALNRTLAAGKILKPASVQEMWKDRGHGYGYGWIPDYEKGRHSVGHSGRVDGFASSMRFFPEEDLFVAVLSNMNGTNTERMNGVLSAIAHNEPFKMPHERKFVTVPATTLAQYDGRYRLPWGLVLIVTHEGDKLFGRAEQEKAPTEWKAESETKFYVPPADIEITFEKDPSGKIVLDFDGIAKAAEIKD